MIFCLLTWDTIKNQSDRMHFYGWFLILVQYVLIITRSNRYYWSLKSLSHLTKSIDPFSHCTNVQTISIYHTRNRCIFTTRQASLTYNSPFSESSISHAKKRYKPFIIKFLFCHCTDAETFYKARYLLAFSSRFAKSVWNYKKQDFPFSLHVC